MPTVVCDCFIGLHGDSIIIIALKHSILCTLSTSKLITLLHFWLTTVPAQNGSKKLTLAGLLRRALICLSFSNVDRFINCYLARWSSNLDHQCPYWLGIIHPPIHSPKRQTLPPDTFALLRSAPVFCVCARQLRAFFCKVFRHRVLVVRSRGSPPALGGLVQWLRWVFDTHGRKKERTMVGCSWNFWILATDSLVPFAGLLARAKARRAQPRKMPRGEPHKKLPHKSLNSDSQLPPSSLGRFFPGLFMIMFEISYSDVIKVINYDERKQESLEKIVYRKRIAKTCWTEDTGLCLPMCVSRNPEIPPKASQQALNIQIGSWLFFRSSWWSRRWLILFPYILRKKCMEKNLIARC